MQRLRTSLAIIGYSLDILRRHPRLLVFPLVAAVALLLAFGFFLPSRDQGPMGWSWTLQATLGTREQQDAAFAALPLAFTTAPDHSSQEVSFAVVAIWYLLGMFIATFVNVALYSQIIAAMNGGKVSVSRGFSLACGKLPAIAAWSLLAGTVGVALRIIQDRIGIPWRWVAALAGPAWSVASVFAIPAILNEPRTRSPFGYLRISTALLRRVWGEGVIGFGGSRLVGALVVVPLLIAGSIVTFATYTLLPVYLAMLACVIVVSLLYLTWQIFACGLYVYATEGVAPRPFNEALLTRAWTVKRNPTKANEDETFQKPG